MLTSLSPMKAGTTTRSRKPRADSEQVSRNRQARNSRYYQRLKEKKKKRYAYGTLHISSMPSTKVNRLVSAVGVEATRDPDRAQGILPTNLESSVRQPAATQAASESDVLAVHSKYVFDWYYSGTTSQLIRDSAMKAPRPVLPFISQPRTRTSTSLSRLLTVT